MRCNAYDIEGLQCTYEQHAPGTVHKSYDGESYWLFGKPLYWANPETHISSTKEADRG